MGGKIAAGVNREISATAHIRTAKHRDRSSSKLTSACVYRVVQPAPPKLCGSPDGPPVTAPRIKLRDGRHLAYKEHGVPRGAAKYKFVYVHGFDSCRHDAIVANTLSMEIVEDLGIYIVSFDRPGYAESDPNPKRTLKSMALDIEELADQLELGSKFYVIGFSMGGQVIWSCIKYIPHRLAGATLLAPVVNYWWPGFPANLSKEAYYKQLTQDQWALRVAHYAPWLTYWWNTQKWFPVSSVIAKRTDTFSRPDKELLPKLARRKNHMAQVRQQGEYESIHRDLIVGFGDWEFDPMRLKNPFPNNEGSVHIWHGDEDIVVPLSLQRYIAQRLEWVHYHELPGAGHMFPYADGMCDGIIKAVLI
ncbi:hypothetical protein SLEP1_g46799 [Rubroshorea leprosula]|uniref:AB hydrolase-1 domain-containing protein n=1 Tax=Rubroshorea leprosula TaxID=152421 RepID=A0AAV5LR41_9ROSI|nr:hypothetical protein SLEP1_g46799 [Rubroshorea leprosula]